MFPLLLLLLEFFLLRMGHTIVTCDETTLYMFGGYSLGMGALNDLWMFDTVTNEWSEVHSATNDKPSSRYVMMPNCTIFIVLPRHKSWCFFVQVYCFSVCFRYFHSAVCVPAVHAIYVFGGLLSDTGTATDELWKFNIDSNRWSQLQVAKST